MERNNIRYLARIVVETQTPLAVSSGEKNIETDAEIIKDVNGLPYIPATSIAGVVRHAMKESGKDNESKDWGFQITSKDGKGKGAGSRIIFTNANIVDEDGVVVDGIVEKKSDFLNHFDSLPIRQHARIDHKGVTVKGGKFDEEIVYKGTRFCFEMEYVNNADKKSYFDDLISTICPSSLRIGGGTRSGFGKLNIVCIKTKELNLENPEDLKKYIEKSSSLSDMSFWGDADDNKASGKTDDGIASYILTIEPDDFFLFGSGFGDDEADMTPISESFISWESGKGEFKDNAVLIPATSVKGAIAHRVAYHYNRLTGRFADKIQEDLEQFTGKNNLAVKCLFGSEGNPSAKEKDEKRAVRGNVMISDVIQAKSGQPDKLLNHVAIDRFTGGAMEGALFTEKVTDGRGCKYEIDITVDKKGVQQLFNNDKNKKDGEKIDNVYKALECALDDICSGLLPLGGGVNRGNGVFSGTRNNGVFIKLEEE